MNIFISWSGPLSKAIGEEFRNWIPAVLQIVKPYFTPDDVEKGTRWSGEIATELEESEVGIIILTRENLQSAWIMFEAGALSKQLSRSRICPILFGIENTDLQGPLVQFQACSFNKEDVRKLIEMINNACGENKLSNTVLSGVFDMWWPKLEENITRVMDKYRKRGAQEIRSERELLEEILSLARVSSIRRVEGGVNKMNIRAPLRHLQLLHDKLTAAVDAEDFDGAKDIIEELNRPITFLSRQSSEPDEMLERPSLQEGRRMRLEQKQRRIVNRSRQKEDKEDEGNR